MHHANNLLQLVRYLDLQNVTLVIHDWGGPIGVGAFIREPQRVSNLIVLNTTIFPMLPDGPLYTNYPIRFLPWSGFPCSFRILSGVFMPHFPLLRRRETQFHLYSIMFCMPSGSIESPSGKG